MKHMSDDLTLRHIHELAAGYVLGDLDDDEAQTLDQLLQQYPEFQVEIDRMQETFGLLPSGQADLDPPPELEATILNAVNFEPQQHPTQLPKSPDPDPLQSAPSKPRSPQSRSSKASSQSSPKWATRILQISVSLAGLLAIGALVFDNQQLRQQIALQTPDEDVVEILQQPNTRLVSLQGAETAESQATGSLLFVAGQWSEVVVTLKGLPIPPDEQMYHLWAEFRDGTVILCGILEPDDSGNFVATLRPSSLPNPGSGLSSVFATLESSPAVNPTGEPVISQI